MQSEQQQDTSGNNIADAPNDIGELLEGTQTAEDLPEYVPTGSASENGENVDNTGDIGGDDSAEDDGRERGRLVMELAKIRVKFDHVPMIVGLIPAGPQGFALLNSLSLFELQSMRSTADVYISSFGGDEVVEMFILDVGYYRKNNQRQNKI